jgi:hypothetical protein
MPEGDEGWPGVEAVMQTAGDFHRLCRHRRHPRGPWWEIEALTKP